MDSKILDLIGQLPRPGQLSQRYGQYEGAKKALRHLCTDGAAYDALCKALAEKYGI